MEFIIECSAPYGFPSFSGVSWSSALEHESAHVAVEDGIVVKVGGAEGEEIEGCSGCCVAEYFEFDVSYRSMDCD